MRRPARTLPPEVTAAVDKNFADRELLAIIRAELRGSYGAWGLPRAQLAEVLESEAQRLKDEDAADRRRARGSRR